LGNTESLLEPQDDDAPQALIQLSQGLANHFQLLFSFSVIEAIGQAPFAGYAFPPEPSPQRAAVLAALVEKDREQPGPQPCFRPGAPSPIPSGNQGFLRYILGRMVVAQVQIRRPGQCRPVPLDEVLQRGTITPAKPLEKLQVEFLSVIWFHCVCVPDHVRLHVIP